MTSTLTTNITEDPIDLLNSRLIWMESQSLSPSKSDMSRLEGELSEEKSDKSGANKSLTDGEPGLQEWNTLDEPIWDTLKRDLRSICAKLKLIVVPIASHENYRHVLKDWDLWGPLIVTTFLALTLHHNQETNSGGTLLVGPHFAQIFVLIWFAKCVISINYKLLNTGRKQRNQSDKSLSGSPTTFQLLCVFGYCLTPTALGVILLNLLSLVMKTHLKQLFYEKLVIGIVFGFVWPTLSSLRIVSNYMDHEKRVLAAYPIGLFYFVISWALITTH